MSDLPLAKVEADPTAPVVANPAGEALNILVSFPDEIRIRMVNASALEDYELWMFLAALSASALVGSAIAFLQARESSSPIEQPLFWLSVSFLVLFGTFLTKALQMRRALRKNDRVMKVRVAAIE